MNYSRFLIAFTGISLLPPPLFGQAGGELSEILSIPGTVYREALGTDLDDAGDVNGDGVNDLLISNGHYQTRIYSGADGEIIHEWLAGRQVANLGDIDGDGFNDFASSAPSRFGYGDGAAYVFSGNSGNEIYSWLGRPRDHFGQAIDCAGDVDADGISDVIIGAIGASRYGRNQLGSVYLFSGATGKPIYRLDGDIQYCGFGHDVAGLGDIDGDGHSDFAVVQKGSWYGLDRPRVFVYSGVDGTQIYEFIGLFGPIENAGDVDGDGINDLHCTDGDWIHTYSGATGWRIHHRRGYRPARAGDLDGDGHEDMLASTDYPDGVPRYRSGISGVIQAEFAIGVQPRFTGVNDLNGNGRPDIAIAYPLFNQLGADEAGQIYVYDFDPFIRISSQAIDPNGTKQVFLDLDFPGTEANQHFTVLASSSGRGPSNFGGIDIPLSIDNTFSRVIFGWADGKSIHNRVGLLNGDGQAQTRITPSSSLSLLAGTQLFLCAITFDPHPFRGRRSSAVVRLSVRP